MLQKQSPAFPLKARSLAMIGNYLPRKCGIATFTTDLLTAISKEAIDTDCWAMVMNDIPKGYDYPEEVQYEINAKSLREYKLAADFLNVNQVDIVSLQHEYGIFGGEFGSHIIELISNLRMPVVTTTHTVLTKPNESELSILKKIGQISDRMISMSQRGKTLLNEIYKVPLEKIEVIPHGIPDVPFVDPNFYKDQFGVEGKKLILTFGLLAPYKGMETMIEALPHVVKKHPEAVYIILGATHPAVLREQGEAYRVSLENRAKELGIANHLIFHNRFVSLAELCEFLGAADVYVTPYPNPEQISSGTLSYALGAGKAVVSTPYRYAEEMLADGRGRLVPFNDAKGMANGINAMFDNETERHAMRKRAYTFCREMVWKEVARKHINLFNSIKEERAHKPRRSILTTSTKTGLQELPQLKLDHLIRMTDDVGLLRHAQFVVANRHHGYHIDDNARALLALLMAQDVVPTNTKWENQSYRYLVLLNHAYNPQTGRFANQLSYDRKWQEPVSSEEVHGRVVWSLGASAALSKSDHFLGACLQILERAIPAMMDFKSPRAWAFGLVGIHSYLKRFGGDSDAIRVREELAKRFVELYNQNSTDEWPWIDDTITSACGKIPQALMMTGHCLDKPEILEMGLKAMDWLMNKQTEADGHFVPVGTRGGLKKSGERARFDQHPTEVQSMMDACREAYLITKDTQWLTRAQCCIEWFLGRNDLGVPVYDYKTGGCCDCLGPDGPNLNQGAESTLAWLLTLLNFLSIRNLELRIE